MESSNWQSIKLKNGMNLVKKEAFEFAHPSGIYDVELFTSYTGEIWAIGVPKQEGKFIVYGSPVVNDGKMALEIVIQKINRETGYDADDESQCGFDSEDEFDETEEDADES